MHLARVDIRLPLLLGDVTVDAPGLETLDVYSEAGCTPDYRSFTAQVPRLRHLSWRDQFAERMGVHCGRPSSVTSGSIELTWNGEFDCREMKECQEMMKQMLQGLLPELPSDGVSEAARPYTTLNKYTVKGMEGELFGEEKLICDLRALMSSLEVTGQRQALTTAESELLKTGVDNK